VARKKKKKVVRDYTSYLIEIQDWKAPYSFHLNHDRLLNKGPYSDHIELTINGIFLYPQQYAGNNCELTFLGDREKTRMLNKPEKFNDYQPLRIGTLSIRNDRRVFLGSFPMDSVKLIINMLIFEKYKYLDFYGYTPRYGSAEIFSMHFEEKLDEDEWGEILN